LRADLNDLLQKDKIGSPYFKIDFEGRLRKLIKLNRMKSKSEKEKVELKKRLARILRIPGNKVCADCPETRPTWISFIKPQQNFALGSKVLASFVCLECAGLHRKLGTHICVVRSISHDQFDDKDVDCVEYSGNEVVNEIFEGHLQKSTMDGINIKPLLGAEVARRERFIRQKYVDLYFYRKRAHYQHISEVNKMISNARKPKSPGSSKSSPTKPSRKKISLFLNDEMSLESEKDAAGCSTTVGNTTITPTNTSRTRTITDRDDSNKSDSYKRRDKKRSKKRASSKKDKASKNHKKAHKKHSSKRRSKSKDLSDNLLEEEFPTIGETSAPAKQPNSSRDLKSKSQRKPSSGRRNSKENDDLSGMILVFDEESADSLDSPKREHRRSSRSKKNLSSSKKQAVDSSLNPNDQLKDFIKKPLVKCASESCDSRDPLATSFRDVRRSRSEITIDEIAKKRDLSISPGNLGKQRSSKIINLGASLTSIDRFSPVEEATECQNKRSNIRKLNCDGDSSQLRFHLPRDAGTGQKTSARNLTIPYLAPSPMSPISVEGIVSEETSYGFGENTIHNMSGTGEDNLISNLEDNSTEDGFRVINAEVPSDRSSSFKDNSWEDKGSFLLPFKNKKAIDGAIKNQSGRRYSCEMDKTLASFNIIFDEFYDINMSNRSIGNKSNRSDFREINRSNRSIGNKPSRIDFRDINQSNRSIGNKSNRSIMSIKSNKSIDNKSNRRISFEEVPLRINPQRSKNDLHRTQEVSQLKIKQTSKRQKKKSRSKNGKSNKKLSLRNQALLEEWRKLKCENQKKFVEFDTNFSNFHE